MRKTILAAMCLFGLLIFGCAKPDQSTNRESSVPAASNTAPSSSTPASTSTASTTSGEKIGIAECDQFIAAYEACVTSKVPAEARAQYNTALNQWRSSWRQLAANPQTKGTLGTACKQAIEQARTSMKTYGCTF
jgi:hypothetical protein